jgi:thiamine-monophosphate kinase
MVEGVHFKLGWSTPQTLGARALAVNLSDIAAMGGAPTACVVNLTIREGLDAVFFDHLYIGLRKAAAAARVDIVGGNITRADQLAITITLLGEVHGKALRRDAARPGDAIYVTGTLGDAALGWRILDGKLRARGAARGFLAERFLNPTARLAAGLKLGRMHPAPAAIDVSDGLWQDLGHILERSRVGAEVDPDAIPRSPAYRTVMGDDLDFALGGGDDYELLFCMRPRLSDGALARRLGVAVHRIGRIVRGTHAILLPGQRGSRESAPRLAGWDQLRAIP